MGPESQEDPPLESLEKSRILIFCYKTLTTLFPSSTSTVDNYRWEIEINDFETSLQPIASLKSLQLR